MSLILNVLMLVQIVAALAMILLILLQHGKGADMGAAFGSGASGSLFGATGGANVLSRATAVLAAVFFICTLALAGLSHKRTVSSGSVLESAPVATTSASAAGSAALTASVAAPVASNASAAGTNSGIPKQ